MDDRWQAAVQLIRQLNEHHYDGYIVGGAVRDRLLSRPSSDIDIVTTAKATEVERIFTKAFRMNNDHETVIVRINGELIEVTTIRGASLEEDLRSRDLTINSIAQNEKGYIDVVNGMNDLKQKRLRANDPDKRMNEDPLRMLRVFRFQSELRFSIDDELIAAIVKNRQLIQTVAIERISKEWIKLLQGPAKNHALSGLIKTGLYEQIPKLSLKRDALERMMLLPSLQAEDECFCLFLFSICQQDHTASKLTKLALANDIIKSVKQRLLFFQKRETEEWSDFLLYKATLPVAIDVEKARSYLQLQAMEKDEIIRRYEQLTLKERKELAITGKDLLGIRPQGKWIKEELDWCEYAVITKLVKNEKAELLQMLERKRKSE